MRCTILVHIVTSFLLLLLVIHEMDFFAKFASAIALFRATTLKEDSYSTDGGVIDPESKHDGSLEHAPNASFANNTIGFKVVRISTKPVLTTNPYIQRMAAVEKEEMDRLLSEEEIKKRIERALLDAFTFFYKPVISV
jgi:hypothetical protein